mgnify:CR=1 FL=1
MKRLFWQFALILLLGGAFAWMADHPGRVIIEWQQTELRTSFAVLAVLMALLIILCLLAQRLWHWLTKDAPFAGPNRTLNRQRRGLDAMNQAVLALARGDGDQAEKHLKQARLLLPPQPMTHILEAQNAQRLGDKSKAEAAFKSLAASDDTRFIGMRGLISEALNQGRYQTALPLLAEAVKIEPTNQWALKTQFEVWLKTGHWREALAQLPVLEKQKVFGGDELATLKQHLNMQVGHEDMQAQDFKAARQHYKAALKTDEGFVPAIIHLAGLELREDKKSAANKLMLEAWKKAPHPEISNFYGDMVQNERPNERLKRIKSLTDKNPNHPLSRLLMAEAHHKAQHPDEALSLLDDVVAETNWKRAIDLKISLIKQKDNVDQSHLSQLNNQRQTAIEVGYWLCGSCHHTHGRFSSICDHCGDFASIQWSSSKREVMSASANLKQPPLQIVP